MLTSYTMAPSEKADWKRFASTANLSNISEPGAGRATHACRHFASAVARDLSRFSVIKSGIRPLQKIGQSRGRSGLGSMGEGRRNSEGLVMTFEPDNE